jgi:hypothetical protein
MGRQQSELRGVLAPAGGFVDGGVQAAYPNLNRAGSSEVAAAVMAACADEVRSGPRESQHAHC